MKKEQYREKAKEQWRMMGRGKEKRTLTAVDRIATN
jgi:hypothetical protein